MWYLKLQAALFSSYSVLIQHSLKKNAQFYFNLVSIKFEEGGGSFSKVTYPFTTLGRVTSGKRSNK